MSLVNMKEMLTAARKAHKAIGAFNITNYETAAAVLKAAEAEKEPVIIQLYMRLFDTGKAYDESGSSEVEVLDICSWLVPQDSNA